MFRWVNGQRHDPFFYSNEKNGESTIVIIISAPFVPERQFLRPSNLSSWIPPTGHWLVYLCFFFFVPCFPSEFASTHGATLNNYLHSLPYSSQNYWNPFTHPLIHIFCVPLIHMFLTCFVLFVSIRSAEFPSRALHMPNLRQTKCFCLMQNLRDGRDSDTALLPRGPAQKAPESWWAAAGWPCESHPGSRIESRKGRFRIHEDS